MLTGKKNWLTLEEKEEKIKTTQAERDEYEKKNLNGFKLIYPCESNLETEMYDRFFQEVNNFWENFTHGKRRKGLPQLTAPHSCVSGNLKSLGKQESEPLRKHLTVLDKTQP